ncbi:ABC transporter ATP-binding protein [Shewanella sp. KX20019]|uniref:ATP-binding cassette domain-containing protein n=1 Tax=Shewanella sp. KX20019 TaxID=2803864 RepID=UPI001928C618|nr:ABC transporter ATP-binding protein [Shewanella sp. KX20019]QQX80930.1 ABC transporter ATP-binding protein [Shewanella sp. KX20019]
MSISKENLQEIYKLLYPQKVKLSLLFTLSILQAVVFTILDPMAIKYLIDAITDGNTRYFVILSLAVTGVVTAGRLIGYFTSLLRKQVKNNLQQQMSIELTSIYYLQDCKEIDSNGKGYYISRIHDEPKHLATVVDTAVSMLTGVVVAISGIGVAVWISWKVTLGLVIILPILYLLASQFSGKIGVVTEKLHESEAEFKSILSTVIDSFKLVKLNSLDGTATREVKHGLEQPLDAGYQSVKYSSMYRSISSVFLSYAELSVMVVAGFQVITGIITIGSLFALTRAFSMIINAVQQLSSILPQLASLNTLVTRYRIFKYEAAISPKKRLPHAGLKMTDVAYEHQGKSIFDNVSINIEASNRTIIRGPNGSGKSTFINLLAGFYHPNSGKISGQNLEDISASLYPFGLLPGCIGKNLSILAEKYQSQDKVDQLVNELKLQDCLESQYDSLSEGQKKKCQIAICLLKPAKTYLFDEPLANIDDASKASIIQLIDTFTKGASLMMIMHEGERFADIFDTSITISGNGLIISSSLK